MAPMTLKQTAKDNGKQKHKADNGKHKADNGKLKRKDYEKELHKLQVELCHLQTG
jgi:polyphosphate kinase 2 (PPK2 family)